MKRLKLMPAVALWLLAAVATVCAQSNQGAKAIPAQNITDKGKPANDAAKAKSAKDKDAEAEKALEAERIVRERRAQATALLISLAVEAGSFRDQALRARSLARIADALWDSDPDRARELFRKAWAAAEVADKEGQQKLQDEINQQKAKSGGSFAVNSPPNLRGEVLRMAARRDRTLGEDFLSRLKAEKEQSAQDASDNVKRDPFLTPEAVRQRLALARQLLDTDVGRAIQFADPALGALTIDGLNFLSSLREKDAAAADERYGAMLGIADASPQSDANTVSFLSSYVFTPHLFVTFQGSGSTSTSQMGPSIAPANMSPEVRAAFFRVATDILMRPLPQPGQDQTTAGLEGTYLMTKRLMPLFEQYASPGVTQTLRTQLDALSTMVAEGVRQRDDDPMRMGIRPNQKSDTQQQTLQDQIDHAKTSAERDGLYARMAILLAQNGDLRAHDAVSKIEDTDLRQQALGFIDVTLVTRAIEKKNAEGALSQARNGQLTHIQRVWALSQVVKLLPKTDHETHLAILNEADAEARRIDGSDPDRPRALMAVANALFAEDRNHSWDEASDAVKAANAAEDFSGEDGQIVFRLQFKGSSHMNSHSVAEFDVGLIFRALAKEDYNRAVDLARGFEHEAPRAGSVIAIARAVLDEKTK